MSVSLTDWLLVSVCMRNPGRGRNWPGLS